MDVGRRADVRRPRVMGGLHKFKLAVFNNISRHEVDYSGHRRREAQYVTRMIVIGRRFNDPLVHGV